MDVSMFALSTGSFSCQYDVDLAVEMDSEKERKKSSNSRATESFNFK